VLVEDIVSVQQAIILSIFVVDLDLASVLNQILHHLLPEGLQLDIEI